MMDANNVTADTFIHASSAHRENTNVIFTSEKLDKSDKIIDAVNNLTINYYKYYESNTATASYSQVNLTRNPETVNHTININFEQKLLSYPTIPVLLPPNNLGIDQDIAANILTPKNSPDTFYKVNCRGHGIGRRVDVQDSLASC